MSPAQSRRFRRLLLTGAAGALGTVLREHLPALADVLRVSDRELLDPAREREEVVPCDLGDAAGMEALTRDVDAVVHMGGVSGEAPFADLHHGNILGMYHLFEGCRKNGVGRVVWASSNHAIGFYPRTRTIDATVPQRPDTNYGLTKAFGEDLAQYYNDKYGIEAVSLRIGSCRDRPIDRRMLATWLSYPDLAHLVERSLIAPAVGHTVVFGVSANHESFWDNRAAAALGFRPRDNAEAYRADIEASTPPVGPDDPLVKYQGGQFVAMPHADDDAT